MKRVWLSIIGAAMMAAMAGAQTAASFLYAAGRPAADQKITFTGWGSGSISETDEAAFEGTTSIRVSSRNFFQGGIMNFGNAFDLSKAYADRNNLLMIAFRTASATQVSGATSGPEGGDGFSAGSMSGGGGGGAARAGGGEDRGGGTTAAEKIEFDTLRMIVTTTDKKKSEIYVKVNNTTPNARGWRSIGVPIQAIWGLRNTNQQVASLAFSGNLPATFYIGELQVRNDATKIYGRIETADMNIGSGTSVDLIATGTGGVTVLKYSWTITGGDLGTAYAEGQAIRRSFRRPGTYTIKCTISDIYNVKDSFTTEPIKITVN